MFITFHPFQQQTQWTDFNQIWNRCRGNGYTHLSIFWQLAEGCLSYKGLKTVFSYAAHDYNKTLNKKQITKQ